MKYRLFQIWSATRRTWSFCIELILKLLILHRHVTKDKKQAELKLSRGAFWSSMLWKKMEICQSVETIVQPRRTNDVLIRVKVILCGNVFNTPSVSLWQVRTWQPFNLYIPGRARTHLSITFQVFKTLPWCHLTRPLLEEPIIEASHFTTRQYMARRSILST